MFNIILDFDSFQIIYFWWWRMMCMELLADQLQSTPTNVQWPTIYSYPITNLCMVDKDGFFSSILNSLTNSQQIILVKQHTFRLEHPVLHIRWIFPSVYSPCTAGLITSYPAGPGALCHSSPLLPDVEVEIVRNMLDLVGIHWVLWFSI